MTIAAVAAVPAAPLLLPSVSPRQPVAVAAEVASLRDDVQHILAGLPSVPTIVLLAAGPNATVTDGGRVDLAGAGFPQVVGDVEVDRELLGQVATRTSSPRVRADRLHGDLAVLTLLVASARPDACVLPVTVAEAAGRGTLSGFAAGVGDAIASLGREVAIVAAGDLSAARDTTSPGYLVEGAVEFDDAALAAVRATDVDALAELGPERAGLVVARGWAPLVVLLHLARRAGLKIEHADLLAPRGVGQLVASSVP